MRRPERVAELLREEISEIVGYELEDPRVLAVTVTDVRVSENLRDASVYVLVEGSQAGRLLAQPAPHAGASLHTRHRRRERRAR